MEDIGVDREDPEHKCHVETKDNTVGHRLLAALKLLHKAQWQQSVSGNKPSEMTLMICVSKHSYFRNEGPKVSDISRLLDLTPPTVTQLLNSLEAKGMVERLADPADRRVVRVQLTEQGKLVTLRAKKHMDRELGKLVDYLGEEESNHLADLLRKVHDFAQKNPPPDLDRLQMNGDEKFD